SGTVDPNAPASTGTFTNVVTVSPPAGVTDPNTGNNVATDTDNVTPQADLSVTIDDGVTTLTPGTLDTYTIVVSNNGHSAVTGATVIDSLPTGVTNALWSTSASSGGATVNGPSSGSGTLVASVDLPVHASLTFTYIGSIDPNATGSLSNTVTVSPPA